MVKIALVLVLLVVFMPLVQLVLSTLLSATKMRHCTRCLEPFLPCPYSCLSPRQDCAAFHPLFLLAFQFHMSRYPPGHPHQQAYSKPPIVVTDTDVLSGRGVNIAAHAGNERFRTLVTTRADDSYCLTYSATEKKAVAEEIVRHIASLTPPGRFLKREGRGQVSRGLNGPWEELSRREAIKKTCQALRDCNRSDRATYAHGVTAPSDVKAVAEELATSGVALRDRAARAAAECAAEASARLRSAMEAAGVPEDSITDQLRRHKADPTYVVPGFAVTASGAYAPVARPGYPAVMQVIGPDGVPVATHDPVPTPGQMPGIYSMYPHPAVDAAPINMEAHLAARAAAGYVHPDDRARIEAEAKQKREMAGAMEKQKGEEAAVGVKEEAAASVAEVAAAAAANMEKVVVAPSDEVQKAAEIAVAAAGAVGKTGMEVDKKILSPEAEGKEATATPGQICVRPEAAGEVAAASEAAEELAAPSLEAVGNVAAPPADAGEAAAAPVTADQGATDAADEMAAPPKAADEVAVAPPSMKGDGATVKEEVSAVDL